MTAFLKMHGLGNDFVVFDARKRGLALDAATRARASPTGASAIGCDQVIVIEPGRNGADAVMRICNADGGEVESCGNATRCVARLLMEETDRDSVRHRHAGRPLAVQRRRRRRRHRRHGRAAHSDGTRSRWRSADRHQPVPSRTSTAPTIDASAVSVGNPHVVLFVDDAETRAGGRARPARSRHHPMFPERTNVEFVSVHGPQAICACACGSAASGITQACGTGACAAAVAALRRGLTGRKVEVVLDGGALAIEWRESDDHVLMTGPATLAFKGEVDLEGAAS